MRSMSVILLSSVALLAPLSAPADEIRLVDGRVLEGEVISAPDADVIDLRTGSGSMKVVQHFTRAQVLSISYGASPRQKALDSLVADRARLGDGGSADEWWALAERARELGDSVTHRELASETVARDRNHASARKALGQIRQRGVWMRPHEAAIARGEVLHNGRSMTWAEREAAVAQAARDRELLVARRAEREKEARERRLRAAAEAAAYYDVPTSTVLPGYHGSYARDCRVVYWPVVGAHQHSSVIHSGGGSGLTVSAGGQGNGFSWGFTWR
jgi:hypothetical protein